jgi:hypothetical protein
MMHRIPRLAASVFGVLAALALADVSMASAQQTDNNIYSTTCGAGTIERCSQLAVTDCDWHLEISAGLGGTWALKIIKSNCRVTGWVPIYKDRNGQSTLSGGCNLLNPFLGMPSGSGCSDDDEI